MRVATRGKGRYSSRHKLRWARASCRWIPSVGLMGTPPHRRRCRPRFRRPLPKQVSCRHRPLRAKNRGVGWGTCPRPQRAARVVRSRRVRSCLRRRCRLRWTMHLRTMVMLRRQWMTRRGRVRAQTSVSPIRRRLQLQTRHPRQTSTCLAHVLSRRVRRHQSRRLRAFPVHVPSRRVHTRNPQRSLHSLCRHILFFFAFTHHIPHSSSYIHVQYAPRRTYIRCSLHACRASFLCLIHCLYDVIGCGGNRDI